MLKKIQTTIIKESWLLAEICNEKKINKQDIW